MFVYLSKKIAIPNNVRLNCISWNKSQGYIAVGGDGGLLKVLKLEQAPNSNSGANRGGLAAVNNLSMNQTLEGHKASIQAVTWNESKQKLTSSDKDGVIIVWMFYKGSWYEEMTNDRKKSLVKDMCWTSDGLKICIIYEDGAVIVGSVDGNRIWGKELKNTRLNGVQWSPDNRLLVFSTENGECCVYDNQGTFVAKINIQCFDLTSNKNFQVVGLSWYQGKTLPNHPSLLICYANGKMQLMRNENDEIPIIVNTNMRNINALWNHDGTIIAVCGIRNDINTNDLNQVAFYSSLGVQLRVLKIPGREITSLSWETKSLRIALAVDSFIYFANIRPEYMWCYFEKTVTFLNSNLSNSKVVFWNTSSNQSFVKEIEIPLGMASSQENCVIAAKCLTTGNVEDYIRDISGTVTTSIINKDDKMYQLLVCNSIGTTVDSKYIDLKPEFLTINSNYVIVASKDIFLLWQYHTSKGTYSLQSIKSKRDTKFHIDDTPSGVVEVLNDLDKNGFDPPINNETSKDPICCIAASEELLIIGRESGTIHEYSIPHVTLKNRYKKLIKPHKISINCNSTRVAIIDLMGTMKFLDLDENNAENKVNINRFERKDVWATCWAKDNPQLLAIMEKTRMYILRGIDPEEPILCSGYICNFEDLEITSILLDDIISEEENQDSNIHIIHLRVKSLRDTEDLLSHVGITEAKQFIEDNPHPRLWRLLAEASLKKLDLKTADNAFVRCTHYRGIQFIKKLKSINSEIIQKAEITAFYGDFDKAEKLYMDADRRDLAINLRTTLCDWFRVVQLYRMGPGISDQQMENAWKEIGNHFANMHSWESAKEYYEKAHYMKGLVEALYHLEQFEELFSCKNKIPEQDPLLGKLAEMLTSVGMCNEAVAAYTKLGDIKSAVSACVDLKQWGYAVELAQKYKMPQISILLSKHAAYLLSEGRLPEAVELQRKAGRNLDAARLLVKLAEKESQNNVSLLRIKKLYVLAGLLTEDHIKVQSSLSGLSRIKIVSELSVEDSNIIQKIWHSAEAYHFILLTQRQLRSGVVHSAVSTALRLREYDDILNTQDIYCLLALASCADRSFGTCSKAFIKLESLDNISEKNQQEYEELAVNIFSRHEPIDKANLIKCFTCGSSILDNLTSCSNCGTYFPPCVASGKPIVQILDAWICSMCNHCACPIEMSQRKTCPFCHSLIILQNNNLI